MGEWDAKPPKPPFRGPAYYTHPTTDPTHLPKRHPDTVSRFATVHFRDRQTDRQTSHMARCVTFAVARIRVGNRRNYAYFSLWHPKYGRQGIQKGLHGSKDRYIYLPTKCGCDWSIVV